MNTIKTSEGYFYFNPEWNKNAGPFPTKVHAQKHADIYGYHLRSKADRLYKEWVNKYGTMVEQAWASDLNEIENMMAVLAETFYDKRKEEYTTVTGSNSKGALVVEDIYKACPGCLVSHKYPYQQYTASVGTFTVLVPKSNPDHDKLVTLAKAFDTV